MGQSIGPFSERQLRQYAAKGHLKPDHQIEHSRTRARISASQFVGLFPTATTQPAPATNAAKDQVKVHRFSCPACGISLRGDLRHAGKKLKCPLCNTVITVPLPVQPPQLPATTPHIPTAVVPQSVTSLAPKVGTAGCRNVETSGLPIPVRRSSGDGGRLPYWTSSRVHRTIALLARVEGMAATDCTVALEFSEDFETVKSRLAEVRRRKLEAIELARHALELRLRKYDDYLSQELLLASYAVDAIDFKGAFFALDSLLDTDST